MSDNYFLNKKIHLVGIKGVGMSALSCALIDLSAKLSGSDVLENFITKSVLDSLKIPILPFSPDNITKDIDLVIYSCAHRGGENPEVRKALSLSIPAINYAKALAKLFENKKVIAVSGTHGKTTTTAMLATILDRANINPSWIIGTSAVNTLEKPGKFGEGEWAVVEADEYFDQENGRAKFLYLNPVITIITGVEWDHPDAYKTHKSYINVFKKLIKKTNPKGVLILNGEDKYLRIISKGFSGRKKFVLSSKVWQNMKLSLPGRHNLLNATYAGRTAHEIGVDQKTILGALGEFTALKRRIEYRGESNKWKVYDDYAHHPTEIKVTLKALRDLYPTANILSVFQSHTISRTKAYLKDFANSFNLADTLFVAPIFTSAREQQNSETKIINSKIRETHKQSELVENKKDLEDKIKKYFVEGRENILITLGAGDIYQWVDINERTD